MLINRQSFHVQWGDCDPAGIVYYPRYLEWFDACTTALFEAAGFPPSALVTQHSLGFPTVDIRTRFNIPSRFGDELTVESTITRFGKSSFDVSHKLLKGSALAAECSETRVWTKLNSNDPTQMHSQPIPNEVIQALSADKPQL